MKNDPAAQDNAPTPDADSGKVAILRRPGHKLRANIPVVERASLPGSSASANENEQSGAGNTFVPNQFTGPSFRNKRERFRFDGHKMMYHLDRVMAWQKGERFAPVHIDMGLTKFCNTGCIYCYAVVQNMDRGTMIASDALLRYIEDCGKLGVRSIGFIGDGEPTLNPALYDAAVLAKRVGVDTSMATNGLLLDLDRAHDMLRDMSWIRFNLSAGTPEGFQRIHQSRKENLAVLKEKIRALVQIRKEYGYTCTLGLQMVLIPENFQEILPEAELGAELGVDYLVIKHCSDSEYGELGINYSHYAQAEVDLKQAESLATDDYVVQVKWNKINAAGETALYREGIRKYDICYGTPFLSQISGNGDVYPCGPFYGKKRFLMGNIHEQSYHDIVMGDRYWAVHADIRTSVDVHKDCAIGCRQDYLNQFLWDLSNPPEHINFI
ncbi:MAG: radical SAM protein [Magnetococcales bacterium]|nr:radical SAM protein [Magnetococcales bacterium]MBF0115245.1 radical SAM protein [Magnetococcales bacterium]